MALVCIKDVPRPPCGCVREGGSINCQRSRGCASDGAWVSYYNALACALGTELDCGGKAWRCCCDSSVGDGATGFDGTGERGCRRLCSRLVDRFRDGSGQVGGTVEGVSRRLIEGSGWPIFGQSDGVGGVDGGAGDRAESVGQGIEKGAGVGLGSVDCSGFPGVVLKDLDSVDSSSVGDAELSEEKPRLTKTEVNRARRVKAKARKARKMERQSKALQSVDWNADKTRSFSRAHVCVEKGKKEESRGYFSSCAEDVKKKLVETRARRLTVENELKVKEMELKMSTMELQRESRLNERRFENERMKVEIEVRKNIEQLPGGTVETVVSSGSISPNSSISLAAENKLRKDLADANKKIAELTSGTTACGSGVGGVVLSPVERELRLANFELESIRLKDRAYGDYTFTDDDYKLSLQALRDEYADVLLSDEKRVERKAVEKVLEVFSRKVDDDDLEKIVKLGYLDADTLIY